MNGDTWDMVGRGFAGWHAKRADVSSSGGDFAGYIKEAREGALVYDASGLEGTDADSAFVTWVVNGPMLDPALAPNEVDSFKVWPRKPAPYVKGEPLGSLDSVGLDLWLSEFRARVPGVKFGWKRGNGVEWE